MTAFSVMLNWFAPDVETREAYCARCGTHVTADRHATKVLCEPCRREYDIMNSRNQHAKHACWYASTGDPEVDLVMSLILHAARDAKDGDRDASQFLVAHDGAELWLRSIGIGVTNQMRRTLKLLAIGAE